jgi:uncharacterized protein
VLVAALTVVSFIAWLASTIAGGGSPFVLMPLVNMLLGAAAVAPVITLGLLIGNVHRTILFWEDIDWQLTLWYAPGAVIGAGLGAYTYTQIHADWLQLLMGLFLIISTVGLGFEDKGTPWPLKAWHMMPAALLKAFFSGLIGTTGPILNPFYLGYGLVKEELVATKATHVTIIHMIKLSAYAMFGVLSLKILQVGLVIGLAAIPANILGRVLLARMNGQQFRLVILSTMTISGLWLIWQSGWQAFHLPSLSATIAP